MRYMQSFNHRLRRLREERSLSVIELADLCGIDERRIHAWESVQPQGRQYPDVGELVHLCVRLGAALETLLDLEDASNAGQLELPGLTNADGDELVRAVTELERALTVVQPSDQERELLRRFRAADQEQRQMILQLLVP